MKNLGGNKKFYEFINVETVDCIISSEKEITVQLGSGATILPGDALEARTIATGRATVLPPVNPVTPVVDIRGYPTLAKCQDTFVLDASNSRGSGGRKFSQIQWGIEETDFTNQLSILLESETNIQLTLNSSLLIPYVTYSFRLVLTNFLGKQSSSVFKVTRSLENSVIFIEAPENLIADANRGFSLTSYIYQCGNPLQHKFSWSQQVTEGKYTGAFLSSAQSSILYVPPLSFTPGSKVTFTVTSTLSLSTSIAVSFLPEQSKILVSSKPLQITSGITPYYLLFSRNTNFYLNLLSSETVSTYWSCKAKSPSSNNCDSCLDSEVADSYFSNSSIALLPAATFHPGSYIFYSGATSVQIDLVSQNSPIVNILSSLEQRQFNVDEKVVLEAHASFTNQITDLNEFTFTWSIHPFVDLGNKVISPAGNSSSQLILLPQSLHPQDYEVALAAVTNHSNYIGKAKILLRVNRPPTGGTCSVNLVENEVFVQCSDWEDPDDLTQSLPIFYLPSVANSEGTERILLLERIPNSHFRVRIPIGSTNFSVTVSDYFGAKSVQSTTLPISGKRKQGSNLELAKNKTTVLSLSIGYLDANSIIQEILAISTLINDIQDSNSPQEFGDKQAIRLQLSQFISSVELADNDIKLLVRVQVLEDITFVPQELLPKTQSLLWQEIISALTLCASTGFSKEEETSIRIGNHFVNVLSKLLLASTNSSESTVFTTKALALVTKSLLVYPKTAFESPTEISSSLIHVQVSRESVNNMLLQRTSSLGVNISLDQWVRDQISSPVVDVAFVTFIEPPLLSASSYISTPVSLIALFSPTGEELAISSEAKAINFTFTTSRTWEFVSCSSWNDNNQAWTNSSCSLQKQTWGNNSYVTCICSSRLLGFVSTVETEAPPFPPGSSPSPLLQQKDQISEETTSRKKLFWLLLLVGIVGVAFVVALLWWNRRAEETIIYKQQPQTPILMSNVIVEDSGTINIAKSLVYGDASDSEESVSLKPQKISFLNDTISDDEYSTKVAQKAIASTSTQATTEQTGPNSTSTKEEILQKIAVNSQNSQMEEQEEGLKRIKSMKEEDSSESDSSTSSKESEEEVMKRTIKKLREESNSSESSSSESSSTSSADT